MKMKKILSSLAIVGAMVAVMGTSSMAADKPTLTLKGPENPVQPGQTATITVYAKNMPKILSATIEVNYDKLFTTSAYENMLSVTGCSGFDYALNDWAGDYCGLVDASHNPTDVGCSGTVEKNIATMQDVAIGASGMFRAQWTTPAFKYEFIPGRVNGMSNGEDGQAIGTITLKVAADAKPKADGYDFDLSLVPNEIKVSDGRIAQGALSYKTWEDMDTIVLESCKVYVGDVSTVALDAGKQGNKINDDNEVDANGTWYTFYAPTAINFETYPGAKFELYKIGVATPAHYDFPSGFTGPVTCKVIVKTDETGRYRYRIVQSDKSEIPDAKTYKVIEVK